MIYGSTIGSKFYEDGRVRRYMGNTVVAPVYPSCPAHAVMCNIRQMVIDAGLDSHFILLPEDSYHMTVISGVNDQRRMEKRWPPNLPMDLPMEEVDDYITRAVESVPPLGKSRMCFDKVSNGKGAFTIHLRSADEEQEKILRDYRDRVAEAIGFRLPGHEKHPFHISLAYTRIVAEGEDVAREERLVEQINAYIATIPPFEIDPPYMAYYDDMLAFSREKISRK